MEARVRVVVYGCCHGSGAELYTAIATMGSWCRNKDTLLFTGRRWSVVV